VPVLDDQRRQVTDPASGEPCTKIKHARLDVAFVDSEGRRSYIDVAVACASTESATDRARRAAKDGTAAADAVRGKHSRYKAEKSPATPLVPFVFEALGRVSPEAHALLRSLAPVDLANRSRVLRHALQSISVLVQTRLAEQLLSAESGRCMRVAPPP